MGCRQASFDACFFLLTKREPRLERAFKATRLRRREGTDVSSARSLRLWFMTLAIVAQA